MGLPIKSVVCAALSLGALHGCAGNAASGADSATALPRAPGAAHAFLLPYCPLDPPTGQETFSIGGIAVALASQVVPTLIDAGYDRLIRAWETRQAGLNASTTFSATGHFYENRSGQDSQTLLEPALRCIVLVREATGSLAPSEQVRNDWKIHSESINGALEKAGLRYWLGEPPAIYAELRIRYNTLPVDPQVVVDQDGKPFLDPSGKALALTKTLKVPVEFEVQLARVFYGQSGAQRNTAAQKKLVLTFDLEARTYQDNRWIQAPLVAAVYDFGQVAPGNFLPDTMVASKAAAKGPLPAPARIPVKLMYPHGTAYANTLDLVAIRATATLTESEDVSDIERWMFDAAKTHRATATKHAQDWLSEQIGRVAD